MIKKYTTLLAISSFMMASTANAIILDDRTTFESSLGSMIVDDYENTGYVFNQNDAAMSAVLGETQYTSTGFINHNLVPDGPTAGNNYYCAGCNGSFLLDFTSTSVGGPNGVYGVGVDFFNQNSDDLYNAFITYGDGSTENILLDQTYFIGGSWLFFGVTSDLLISSIHFGLENGGATVMGSFGIDNLTIGSGTASVPAPGALALFSLGLIGIGLSRKKQL